MVTLVWKPPQCSLMALHWREAAKAGQHSHAHSIMKWDYGGTPYIFYTSHPKEAREGGNISVGPIPRVHLWNVYELWIPAKTGFSTAAPQSASFHSALFLLLHHIWAAR